MATQSSPAGSLYCTNDEPNNMGAPVCEYCVAVSTEVGGAVGGF